MRVVCTALLFAAGFYLGFGWSGDFEELEDALQQLATVLDDVRSEL